VSSPRRRPSAPAAAIDPLLAAGIAPVADDLAPAPPVWIPEPAPAAPPAVPTETLPVARPATAPVPIIDPGLDLVPDLEPQPQAAPKPKPKPKATTTRAPRRGLFKRRPRVRRVTRVIRRVDPWGVFKISALFFVLLFGILLVAGVLLWNLARTTGTVENIEGFVAELFGLETFTINGGEVFRASWTLGVIFVIAGTGFTVTLAVLFNLLADLVGGVRVTVLEEETVLRPRPQVPRRRRRRVRTRPHAAGPPPAAPAEDPIAVDGDGAGTGSLAPSPGL